MWGNPGTGSKIGTRLAWNSTAIAVPTLLGALGIMPAFFDEIGQSGDTSESEWHQQISNIAQGAFRLRFRELSGRTFGNLKLTPHVVFAAPVDAPGEIGDFIRARVGEGNLAAVRSGQAAAVTLRENLWADGQLVTIATAASDS